MLSDQVKGHTILPTQFLTRSRLYFAGRRSTVEQGQAPEDLATFSGNFISIVACKHDIAPVRCFMNEEWSAC